jgi:UDP-N-acetylglucosamine/UDP-N-acetylgalactosamine diphosphorylase
MDLQEQRNILFHRLIRERSLTPPEHYDRAGTPADDEEGKRLTAQGQVACLILAGGQGSRLGVSGPKGTVPLSLIKKKSLFQLCCEKTLAASQQAERSLPIAVMTSPLNHQQTEAFLSTNGWFGLNPSQIDLFSQKMLPFLDDEGSWVLESSGKVAEGPDGNGGALKALYHSGIWKKWESLGVCWVHVILIDNPLADPFDHAFVGYHRRQGGEASLKCVLRERAEENVGIIALEEGKLCIVDYFELSGEQRTSRHPDGSLSFPLANTGLFCLNMSFIKKVAEDPLIELPWHLQRREIEVQGYLKKVWKYETFIFDLLPYAQDVSLLCYPREEIFAPLKNSSGGASLKSVQAALLCHDREIYARLSGIHPPQERCFELDPAFYYPTPSLLKRWRGRPLPAQDYILP